ncbi:hypothetical protein ANAPH1_00898 [Anaplasma phagocytophilum]|nr:hypothetical protein ANAPH1_00121 [Anaplasma phagocytophilum]SCV65819.1 hypothetical protein ANAPH1_00898 [Anaplasma phagocytophilum]
MFMRNTLEDQSHSHFLSQCCLMLRKISNVLEDCKSVHGERGVLVVYEPTVKSQSLAIQVLKLG